MAIKLLFFNLAFLAFGFATTSLQEIEIKYQNQTPKLWGESLEGIITHLSTQEPIVFLTLDACSGSFDYRILSLLEEHQIPATLFINARWLDKHQEIFKQLVKNPLFSLQNHGTKHQPLSVNGNTIYHIQGTKNIQEVYEEIMQMHQKMIDLGAKPPRFFRSGTAYYDEIALRIIKDLGYKAVGFDVIGDGGATFKKDQIIEQAKLVKNGSILIYHFNHPEKDVFEGLKQVIKILKEKGFVFKKLEDYF